MRKILLLNVVFLLTATWAYAQKKSFWAPASEPPPSQTLAARNSAAQYKLFALNFSDMTGELATVPSREQGGSATLVSFPTPEGESQTFRVVEASVLHPDLAAKYQGIRSFTGQGIEDPTAVIRFSTSDQQGFHGMVFSGNRSTYYIDPYTKDRATYKVYGRESLTKDPLDFECKTIAVMNKLGKSNSSALRTNDKTLRRYRLALSCTAEYGNIFAGTTGTDAEKKARILAQMNVTMTRVNGVYERDLAITMQIVANNDLVIYLGSVTADPWTTEWNTKTQQVTDAAIGSANYDIGHNFNTTGGGNAGCIGCVCTAGSKGSGYTGRADPTGDAFDIDYVAHEMGHQFGGYHVMNTCSRSGSGTTEVEPASGSSIMGYAGICPTNIQPNSDAYFAYVNIRDISANVQTGTSSGCAQIVTILNNPPTANAGADYTIPKSTAFVLKGQGSDPDGDALTYTWEQNDAAQAPGTGSPVSTWTVGPMFRSKTGTASPSRYMPQISDVVANNLAPTWEVIPSVARTLNFSLTTRDNKAGGGQTSDDLMLVTVNGTAGPFVVSAPNTAVTWNVGTSQTVTWSVASTNVAPVNCLNVNILLSTDGGFTYPIALLSNTPNDGTEAITVPNNLGTTCRVKVEAADNIFYDISNVNFTISGAVSCTATVPTGLAVSGITSTSATLNWAAVAGATYDVQYRVFGTTTWTVVAAGSNSLALTGLTVNTQYETQVRSKCTATTSAYSASVNFTTLTSTLVYCASKGASVADEYIGRVQVGTINNATGANAGYGDFTALSTNLSKSSAYTLTVTPTWTATVFAEGYAAWIDYNIDGDFADVGELVWSKAASTTTPASGSFTVPATATTGATRMRVSMKYNAIPTSCEAFSFGEVEDYTVNIQTAVADTQAPTAPGAITVSSIIATSASLSWGASTDNVGVTGYEVRLNSALVATVTATTYSPSGLTASTAYSVSVTAKDAAGNSSTATTASFTTTAVAYCASKGSIVTDEYIGRVQLGTINNLSGANAGYGDFTALSTNLGLSTAYTITVTPTWTATVFPEGYAVWIDYNRDGDFVDAGELVWSKAASTTTPVSGTFTVPSTATLGSSRVRVSMKYNAIPTSCEAFTYGEVEDYTVNIQSVARPAANADAPREASGATVYPNPVLNRLYVYLASDVQVIAMRIISANGSTVREVATYNDGIEVSELNPGLYLLFIETNRGSITRKFLKD
jgi:Metallo-peptidase family M12B Reprolysin-like/GEVED domain/Secretion system C-terminal sorting domain/Fibronectin type III domain